MLQKMMGWDSFTGWCSEPHHSVSCNQMTKTGTFTTHRTIVTASHEKKIPWPNPTFQHLIIRSAVYVQVETLIQR